MRFTGEIIIYVIYNKVQKPHKQTNFHYIVFAFHKK